MRPARIASLIDALRRGDARLVKARPLGIGVVLPGVAAGALAAGVTYRWSPFLPPHLWRAARGLVGNDNDRGIA